MASAGRKEPATKVRRLVFTIPILTAKSDEEINEILEDSGPEIVRMFESFLWVRTKLRPWRMERGPSVKPVLGKESRNAL